MLERWFEAGGAPGHVDGPRLASWLAARRRNSATATVNMDIKALRAYYRWRVLWRELEAPELRKIPRMRRPPQRLVRYLTDGQIGRVLGNLPLDTFVGIRDHAILLTLYVLGLRASELVGMEIPDVIDREVLYVRGKGGKDRYLPVPETLVGVWDGYLHARNGTKPGKRYAFWVKRNGRAFANGRSVWEIVSKRTWQALGRECGLFKLKGRGGRPWQGHYPHEYRASFATALLHNGMDLRAIGELMGHSSLDSTAKYLGVDLPYLRSAMAKHPRAGRIEIGDGGEAVHGDDVEGLPGGGVELELPPGIRYRFKNAV